MPEERQQLHAHLNNTALRQPRAFFTPKSGERIARRLCLQSEIINPLKPSIQRRQGGEFAPGIRVDGG